ncbi:MAG: tetratricopeptide repeat protein [Alistipes sp.]|nr:tetratricopeptide repeat protein [Alistipes sp.]
MISRVRYIVVVLALFVSAESLAQKMPERGWTRWGNIMHHFKSYPHSVAAYEKALEQNPDLFEAQYNLASAMIETQRYDAAEKILSALALDTLRTEKERRDVLYNLGNAQFAQQKFDKALESYRNVMRMNPDDEDAKFNYAYTKLMQQQQQQQQEQNQEQQQQQDQNQENKEQGQNDQNQNNQDQNKEDKNNPQNKENSPQNQDKQNQQQQNRPQQNGISPEQQEAMLQAIQAEEDKTQDKLKEQTGGYIYNSKNW